jgi:hypothetical protein
MTDEPSDNKECLLITHQEPREEQMIEWAHWEFVPQLPKEMPELGCIGRNPMQIAFSYMSSKQLREISDKFDHFKHLAEPADVLEEKAREAISQIEDTELKQFMSSLHDSINKRK